LVVISWIQDIEPDGSRLTFEKNGQGQVIALKRSKVHTSWLQGLETPQVIVKDLQRDMVGLRSFTSGNGVQTKLIRSKEGTLARTVHVAPIKAVTAMTTIRDDKPWKEQVSVATFGAMQTLLGITPAHAAASDAAPAQPSTLPSAQPGALGQPQEAGAIIDHRYLWDASGNLRYVQHSAGEQKSSAYAYDMADRLIVAQTRAAEVQASSDAKVRPVSTAGQPSKDSKPEQPEVLEQYFYDAQGRRVLAQRGGITSKTGFDKASHRWVQDGTTQASYDQAGQPKSVGSRTYQWDAAGRLIQTSDGTSQTSYAYDHRGLRNTKHTKDQTTHYVHDESRQLQAELDDQGQLTRQYVYMADQPLATIDTPSGQALSQEQQSMLSQVMQDISVIVKGWVSGSNSSSTTDEQLTWLHLNHLGAPEAATDHAATVVWQASYQSFGQATIKTSSIKTASINANGYTLHIRLPGQYEDQETGLHYNRQRYYDPARGSYLTPDPLGTPDGPNGYAYVRYNPAKYVDPDGLVLFAFDGTGNTNDPADLRRLGNGISNVWQFSQLYRSGNSRYITGVGTEDRSDPTRPIRTGTLDLGVASTGGQRISRMREYFLEELEEASALNRRNGTDLAMDIDIVGFSRGAAQAREFANQINAVSRRVSSTATAGQETWSEGLVRERTAQGERLYYRYRDEDVWAATGRYQYKCQRVNFRFMGLWDTVLSTHTGTYRMAIPATFAHVAQAVALNEYRGMNVRQLPGVPIEGRSGAFPLESIMGESVPAGQTRIEMGFIGAHADIGGGFPDAGDESALARVALSWMRQQAVSSGINMQQLQTSAIPSSPIIHDKSEIILTGGMGAGEDREVRYLNGNSTTTPVLAQLHADGEYLS
jgi:RHS repeat-associated protein